MNRPHSWKGRCTRHFSSFFSAWQTKADGDTQPGRDPQAACGRGLHGEGEEVYEPSLFFTSPLVKLFAGFEKKRADAGRKRCWAMWLGAPGILPYGGRCIQIHAHAGESQPRA